jgi:hypothetical protein
MFGITNPLFIKLAEYLLVIALVCGAFYYVYEKGFNACDAQWIVKRAQANAEAQTKYNAVATKLENTKAERIVQTNTITKIVPQIVEREVYKNICVDSQGVDVINKALKGEAYELPK